MRNKGITLIAYSDYIIDIVWGNNIGNNGREWNIEKS